MNKHIFLTLTLFVLSLSAFAQDSPSDGANFKEKREQVKALKVAFITEELKLTPDEAAKFWPVYNAFDNKQHEIRQKKMKAYMDRSDDKLSEKEALALLNQMENNADELYQLKKKFSNDLKGILPATKIIKLKKAEDEFGRKLLQQYRDKKDGK